MTTTAVVVAIMDRLSGAERQAALWAYVRAERTDASQSEWERWRRANGVASALLRQTVEEVRAIVTRLDIDAKDVRELERHMAGLIESAQQLDGDGWLKSPRAMAELRKENGR